MNILFVGDPHLKITRFDLAKRFLSWLEETVKASKPDLVVILGDAFDTHAVLRSEIMSEFMNCVYGILSSTPCIYLLGNHDMFKPNDATYHALSHLVGKIPNFTIVDKTAEHYDITFVPYIHNPELFPKNTKAICVAHQTFKGADYGDITTKDGVDSESVSADVIISGHIHKKQRLGKVIYPGSPFSQGVSDINQIKGVMMFDTATLKETHIQCPLPIWRGDKFILDQTFSIDDLHSYVEGNLKNSIDHWVIDITGTKADISSYLSSKRHKEAIEGIDIKIKTSYIDKEKRQVRIEALSIEDIVSQYVTKVYSGSLDKDLLRTKAIELIKR